MKKHIPNLITSLNVISGTLAIFMAMYGNVELAALLILVGMVFDFFDGMAARLLHVKSEMGKELDSLADVVSFGVAPAILAHMLLRFAFLGNQEGEISDLALYQQVLLFTPLIIPAFSAYRLAKFNLDTRQTLSFIGMPTPANALFWVSLVYAYYHTPEMYSYLFGNIWVLITAIVILSVLLICELPMFSLKLTNFSWRENKIRYTYLLSLLLLLLAIGTSVVPFVIPLYILFAVIDALRPTAPKC